MADAAATEAIMHTLLFNSCDEPLIIGSEDPVLRIPYFRVDALTKYELVTATLDFRFLQPARQQFDEAFLHTLVKGVVDKHVADFKQQHPRCLALDIIFPPSLVRIEDDAFFASTVFDGDSSWSFYVASVNFKDCARLNYIGISAFCGNAIETLVFPPAGARDENGKTVTLELDKFSFEYSTCLSDITWGSVARVGSLAFSRSELRYLNFEGSLLVHDDNFGSEPFDHCTRLQYIRCLTAVPSGVLEKPRFNHPMMIGRIVVVPDEGTRRKAMEQVLPIVNIHKLVTADDANAYFRETWVKKRVGQNVPWITPGTARLLDDCVRSCEDLFEKYEFQPLRENLRTLVASANRAKETVQLPHLPNELVFGEIAKYYCDMTLQAQ